MEKNLFAFPLLIVICLVCFTGKHVQSEDGKIKVAVYVQNDDSTIDKNLMISHIRNELRNLESVEIVPYETQNWEFCISILMLHLKELSNAYAMYIGVDSRISANDFMPKWRKFYDEYPAVHFSIATRTVQICPISKFRESAKSVVTILDTKIMKAHRR